MVFNWANHRESSRWCADAAFGMRREVGRLCGVAILIGGSKLVLSPRGAGPNRDGPGSQGIGHLDLPSHGFVLPLQHTHIEKFFSFYAKSLEVQATRARHQNISF